MRQDDPSSDVYEAIRRCAHEFLARTHLLDELDAAVVDTLSDETRGDPALVAAISASNRSNVLHWVRSLARDPYAPVPANTSPDVLDPVYDVVRRGLELLALDGYRIGQHLLHSAWNEVVLSTVDDASTARQILRMTSTSLADFVGGTMRVLLEKFTVHREEAMRDSTAERLRAASWLVEGAPIADARAEALLRYRLQDRHCAAILWSDESTIIDLQQQIDAVLRVPEAPSPLLIKATKTTLWVWWSWSETLTPAKVAERLGTLGPLRAAVGTAAAGRSGFVQAHLHARAVQDLVLQATDPPAVTCYDDVQAIIVAMTDRSAARDLVRRTLGDRLLSSPDLVETLRLYVRLQSNATRTAEAAGTHRNTIQARVDKALRTLPGGRDIPPLQLELALELSRWLSRHDGSPTAASQDDPRADPTL